MIRVLAGQTNHVVSGDSAAHTDFLSKWGRLGWPCGVGLISLLWLGPASFLQAALVFNLGSTGNANADAGFQRAADAISDRFSDSVTINVTTGFSPLSASILGEATSSSGTHSYASWKSKLISDATSVSDTSMTNSLPAGSLYTLYINRTADNPHGSGSATPYVDSNGGANNSTLRLTTANSKALGLISPTAGGNDATVTFNSNFTWDFDPSDGIAPGAFDFVGVATHELFHAMGFTSGVDILDINSPPVAGPFDADDFTFVTGLDFTRHSSESQQAGADIDWTADARDKYFSIDGGLTNLTPGTDGGWSTGENFGDGFQASHWKDQLGLGLMDPTGVPAGMANVLTAMDIQALDVIGWDVRAVPEPSTWVLAALALGIFAGVSRTRSGRAGRP